MKAENIVCSNKDSKTKIWIPLQEIAHEPPQVSWQCDCGRGHSHWHVEKGCRWCLSSVGTKVRGSNPACGLCYMSFPVSLSTFLSRFSCLYKNTKRKILKKKRMSHVWRRVSQWWPSEEMKCCNTIRPVTMDIKEKKYHRGNSFLFCTKSSKTNKNIHMN